MEQEKGKLQRDERFDLFRGIALIGITLNHMVPTLGLMREFGQYQLKTGLFFNFADVFVFISGCVGGIAYTKLIQSDGLWRCQVKSTRRVFEIFLNNMVTCIACLAVILLTARFGSVPHILADTAFRPLESLMGTVFIYDPMPFFNILGLYIVLLLLLPAYLQLYLKRPLLAFSFTLLVYLFSQVMFYLFKRNIVEFPFFGNLYAWQFIFFIGASIGAAIRQGRFNVSSNRFIILAVLMYFLMGDFLKQTEFAYFHFTDKDNLGFLRVVDLLCVSYLISLFMPKTFSGRAAVVRPLINLGRNALEVFCLGLLISYIMTVWLANVALGRSAYLLAATVAVLVLYGLGGSLYQKQSLKQWLQQRF